MKTVYPPQPVAVETAQTIAESLQSQPHIVLALAIGAAVVFASYMARQF